VNDDDSDDDVMEDAAEYGRDSPYLVERLIALWNLVDNQGTLLVPKSPLTKDRCPKLYKVFAQQL
jgi:hypothetical protein